MVCWVFDAQAFGSRPKWTVSHAWSMIPWWGARMSQAGKRIPVFALFTDDILGSDGVFDFQLLNSWREVVIPKIVSWLFSRLETFEDPKTAHQYVESLVLEVKSSPTWISSLALKVFFFLFDINMTWPYHLMGASRWINETSMGWNQRFSLAGSILPTRAVEQKHVTTWWFQILFIFTLRGNDPIWLIFFQWVETTN